MLVGTVLGVLIIPGLYYFFGGLAGTKKLLRDEVDEPLSECLQPGTLPPDHGGGSGAVHLATHEGAPPPGPHPSG
jgi:HAE1 family hydrophobic/amphiphilic exporter-1